MTKLDLENQLEEVIDDCAIKLPRKDLNRLIDGLVGYLVEEMLVDLEDDEEDE